MKKSKSWSDGCNGPWMQLHQTCTAPCGTTVHVRASLRASLLKSRRTIASGHMLSHVSADVCCSARSVIQFWRNSDRQTPDRDESKHRQVQDA
eukprot:COSAG02_NODE_305_length_25176_cov_30.787455_17_plen_93_part_00